MRSSTEATRLGRGPVCRVCGTKRVASLDSELQTRSEQTGDAVRAFCSVHESGHGHESDFGRCPLSRGYQGHSGHERLPNNRDFMSTRPSVMGPVMSSLPE
jgi:hypothetical protein